MNDEGTVLMPSIAVRNFGPIADAEVDLKPLTVLIGSNNTGKSYLALAIYSLSRAIAGTHDYQYRRLRSRALYGPLGAREGSVRSLRRAAGNLKNITSDLERILSGEIDLSELPPKISAWMKSESRYWSNELSQHVRFELRRCFGTTIDQLGRNGHDSENLDFDVSLSDKSTGFGWDISCRKDELVTNRWEVDLSLAKTRLDSTRYPPPKIIVNNTNFLTQVLLSEYSRFLLSGYSAPSHYLPASRSGILQGHKTMANLIVGRASSAWIEPMEVERLPGVITDLIQALLILEPGMKTPRRVKNIADFLEKSVVSGTVDVRKQSEYPDLRYENISGEFSLHQVSSMVSEIAPFVLFLKYLVRAGHLFIFEEPESHLDPANQSRIARAIAMLVNSGVRVLVTTHSDIFLNQINNLMQTSNLNSRRRLRMGYKATEVLKPTEVSAYLFQADGGGTHVRQLAVDAEYGITTESFDNVHRSLYDESIQMEHRR